MYGQKFIYVRSEIYLCTVRNLFVYGQKFIYVRSEIYLCTVRNLFVYVFVFKCGDEEGITQCRQFKEN
jgi:hypothetical protein